MNMKIIFNKPNYIRPVEITKYDSDHPGERKSCERWQIQVRKVRKNL